MLEQDPNALRRARGVWQGSSGLTAHRTHAYWSALQPLLALGDRRMAFGLAQELRPHGAAALALSPGHMRTERVLQHFRTGGVLVNVMPPAIASLACCLAFSP